MTQRTNPLITAVLMVLVFILQVALLPNLAIGEVVAEISLCFAIANAMRVSQGTATACGFILGLSIDLAVGSPLGIRAMSYCLVAYAVSPIASMTILEGLVARYLAMIGMIFVGELIIALLVSIISVDINLGFSIITRVIPGWLFDSVLCLLFLPLVRLKETTGMIGFGKAKSTKSLKESLPPL
ncbi:MAG: rod shape-determining protein MreD [Coriobacteriales bacterium]|jgi:rod shape-determining protein MreD|nr:rod shape-determining protein MreD [Coriobacteriales bacterium]